MYRVRSAAQLAQFSHRLGHEVQIFFEVVDAIARSQTGLEPPHHRTVDTALVESFALHARALADFFYTEERNKRHQEDAFALDFFPAGEWSRLRPPAGPWSRAVRQRGSRKRATANIDRFGAEIGHLSFAQIATVERSDGWPTMQIAAEIGVPVNVFATHVAPTNVHSAFASSAIAVTPLVSRLDTALHPMGLWTRPAQIQAATGIQ